jgi:Zn-dependent protease
VQTLSGLRFLPVARIDGIQLGLDASWLGLRGVGFLALLTAATLAGQLGPDSATPFWVRLGTAGLIVPAIALTSLVHELGHVLASRLAGLSVRAVVLAPQGGVTIRSGSDEPVLDLVIALAGPVGNALLGVICVWLAVVVQPEGALASFVLELAVLQLLTAAANLVPIGRLDGTRMLAAWRSLPRGPLPTYTLPVV